MLSTARSAGKQALVLVDEAATGTDPQQGAALARAMMEAGVEAVFGPLCGVSRRFLAFPGLYSDVFKHWKWRRGSKRAEVLGVWKPARAFWTWGPAS